MLKKFLTVLFMLFIIPAFADTMPFYINSVPKEAIGVYQTGDNITIFSHPDTNSHVLKKYDFTYKPDKMPDNMFAVLLNEKHLGMLYVSDVDDDGWVQVIYDKRTGAKGWVLTEDRMQFLPWLNFYNLYGRKYGLRIFKNAPEEVRTLHSQSEDLSQNIAVIKYEKFIKLTALSGNWALVTVSDLDKIPKIGYIKWRSSEGVIYVFPNIK